MAEAFYKNCSVLYLSFICSYCPYAEFKKISDIYMTNMLKHIYCAVIICRQIYRDILKYICKSFRIIMK